MTELEIMRIFGVRIRARRLTLGLTLAEAAQAIHVSESTLSNWERGVGGPTVVKYQGLREFYRQAAKAKE